MDEYSNSIRDSEILSDARKKWERRKSGGNLTTMVEETRVQNDTIASSERNVKNERPDEKASVSLEVTKELLQHVANY